MLTHGASVARVRGVDERGRPARRRPLPRRQPVLPHVRPEGRHSSPASTPARRSCRTRCSTSTRDAARRRRADLDAPGRADDLPVDPRPSRRAPSSTCRRCASRSRARRSVPVELIERMRAELSFETIVTGYGLTEATGIATMCRHDDRRDDRHHRRPGDPRRRGARRRRRRQRGRAGEPGEVVVRGYNIMRASSTIRERPPTRSTPTAGCTPATSASWTARHLRITDRKKDMYIVGGFNAYPAEIETGSSAHPERRQGRRRRHPGRAAGRGRMAFVVPVPGHASTRRADHRLVPEKMANYKVPRQRGGRRRAAAERERQGAQVRAAYEAVVAVVARTAAPTTRSFEGHWGRW